MKYLFIPLLVALLQTPASGQSMPKPVDVLSDAIVSNANKGADVVMTHKGEVATKNSFRPPLRITYVAKTNTTDLRIGYAANQIIFNWKDSPQELRIDGGPANGRHVQGGGKIPKGTFVTIVQDVTPTRMTISVDGVIRATWDADFSGVNEQIRVFPNNSTVTVHSITVSQLK